VATQDIAELTPPKLVQLMVGRHLDHDRISRPVNRQQVPALSIRDFKTTRFPTAPGINFDVHSGEIVGIAGLVGSGRTEVLRAIFGADRRHAGRIERKGAVIDISTPADAIANGLCLVTENRKEEGLILQMSIAENTTIASIGDCSRGGFLSRRAEADIAQKMAKTLDIRMRDVKQEAKSLSGGNQQKVVLAKWLLAAPSLLMLDEPTRGIDVGAKAEIYSLLRKLADDGVAVLFVSSDVPEILGLADRILVMSRGVLAGELNGDTASEEEILTLAYSEYLKGSQSNG
jgi:ribose transport system ATP-binding protein